MNVRVVSMPCTDLFEEQSAEYKESVLPKTVRRRVAVEALSGFGWERYTGLDGKTVTMDASEQAVRRRSCLRSLDLRWRTLWRL